MKHCLSVYSTGATVSDVVSRAIHYCCLVYSDLFELDGRFEECLTIYKISQYIFNSVPFDLEWMSLQQDSVVYLLNHDFVLLSYVTPKDLRFCLGFQLIVN